MFSALHPNLDVARCGRHFAFVPGTGSCSAANRVSLRFLPAADRGQWPTSSSERSLRVGGLYAHCHRTFRRSWSYQRMSGLQLFFEAVERGCGVGRGCQKAGHTLCDHDDGVLGMLSHELLRAGAELQLKVELLQQLPVSAWTLKPDGTPDFVNRVWLEFAGQSLDFIRSNPEAGMTAIHPEDRET